MVPGQGGAGEHWPVEPGALPGEYHIVGHLAHAGGYFVHVEPMDPTLLLDATTVPAAVVVSDEAIELPAE